MSNEPKNLVNANIGITNIIEHDEILSTMMETFIELAEKLKKHCGPFSGTAILTNPDDMMAEPVFTKDGINIVNAISYAAPMQDFVRKQLAYMGARIDRSAGDGTTSSMIIMAYTMSNLLNFISSTDYKYSNVEMTKVWSKLLENLIKIYDRHRDRAKSYTDPDDIEFIAGSQAYTSSHGDEELAKCIGTLFKNTPSAVWKTLTLRKAVYETEDKYRVSIDDAQYTLDNCTMFPNDRCNKELGTVLELDNATCLLQTVTAIGDDYQKEVNEFIKNHIESGEQLIVITQDTMDSTTRNHYQELFTNNPKHNTVFIMVPSEDAMINDINALSVLVYQAMSKDREDGEIFTFKADVRFEGSTFRFKKGLLVGDSESGINPYFENKDYPVYNEFVDSIRRIIEKEKADVVTNNNRAIRGFVRILHKLVSTKDVVFTVGGQAYDNAAAVDIAQDALLATKSSLTKGFVAGRSVTLRSALKELKAEAEGKVENKFDALYNAYLDSMLMSIEEVNKALSDSINKSDNIKKALEYDDSPADFTKLDDPSYVIPIDLASAIRDKSDYCIIQPIETDLTFMKRFGEVGLKFLTANRVITTGYLFSNKRG